MQKLGYSDQAAKDVWTRFKLGTDNAKWDDFSRYLTAKLRPSEVRAGARVSLDKPVAQDLISRLKAMQPPPQLPRSPDAPAVILPGAPLSPEHRAQRWKEYQDRGGSWTYEEWSAAYERAIRNAKGGLAREAEYRLAWGGENRIVNTPYGQRQIDVHLGNRLVQIKTGQESLTTTGPQNNTDAIRRDAWLVKRGYQVEWVLEKGGSQPLLDALKAAGIKVHTGPQIK
jgi:hypothetical protein